MIAMQADLDQIIMEFVARADDIGPFSKLSELGELLESVSPTSIVRETSLYSYLRGVFDARCHWDQSRRNDLIVPQENWGNDDC